MLLGLASCHQPAELHKAQVSETPEQPSRPKLDAALPAGLETDPFAIHHAQGITDVPNRSMVERLREQLKLTQHSFENLTPKRTVEGVFRLAAENFWPPDAAGTGPFFLIKEGGGYFVLTERNFARVYGPVETESEVLPYVDAYGTLFLTAFGSLVMKKEEQREGNTIYYPSGSPEVTRVQSRNGGYQVRLVYYTGIHQECFYAIDVEVQRDGTVRKLGQMILKELGPGIVF